MYIVRYYYLKHAVRWHVFRHVTECNTNKQNKINVPVFWTLGGGLGL